MSVPAHYITVAEAARRLDRSLETVRRLCNTGQLTGVKTYNAWWVDPASVAERAEFQATKSNPKMSDRAARGNIPAASQLQIHPPAPPADARERLAQVIANATTALYIPLEGKPKIIRRKCRG